MNPLGCSLQTRRTTWSVACALDLMLLYQSIMYCTVLLSVILVVYIFLPSQTCCLGYLPASIYTVMIFTMVLFTVPLSLLRALCLTTNIYMDLVSLEAIASSDS
jgi:hypothetical protein